MIKSLKDLLDKLSRFTNSLVYDGGICKRLNSKDIFVHHNEINNRGYGKASLADGQKVSFNIGVNQKGEHATGVETL
ncbi:hypothetical protein GCM10012288_20690 [Malaciobacter pacificus]|uniref:cold shock domain-containing protein n=1 Tax=Malaciobacter pacificus TaxID=1080223 RepID=UPI0010296892|nr:cold shock domain-containing protein [Malaciobacter pacificus]GGD46286.1 hypothetical protein GCM10012288_20690 [Malaciobacter pacificus]